MNARDSARTLALARLAIGLSAFIAPSKTMRIWIGQHAKPYPTNMVLRGFGARDAAIAIGILTALETKGSRVRGWLEASAVADISDALATLSSWRDLPKIRALLLLATEVGAAVLGMQLAAELD